MTKEVTPFETEPPLIVQFTPARALIDCTVDEQLVPMVAVRANNRICVYDYIHNLAFLEIAVLCRPGIDVGSVVVVVVFDLG